MKKVVCFGEVLWDLFPEEKKLGGAPLNVALRIKSWGMDSQMISSVGNDIQGQEIIAQIKALGLDPKYIQINNKFDTGSVTVTLDQQDSASYEINHPVSWDKIELQPEHKELLYTSDAFVFGSLVARDSVSKKCLIDLLEIAPYPVFDVNLRVPHYSIPDVELFMSQSNFIKFNDEEIEEICVALGMKTKSLKEQIQFIANKTDTPTICVTLGKDGAVLFHEGVFYTQKGYPAQVMDTVGAGDSFLGTLLSLLLQEKTPDESLGKACAMGALVAQEKGANPVITEQMLSNFMKQVN